VNQPEIGAVFSEFCNAFIKVHGLAIIHGLVLRGLYPSFL
jgi:hypothetical protein